MKRETFHTDAPEWATRLLTIPEFAAIVRENPVTVYRKVKTGIYPPILHLGRSSRLKGWECWDVVQGRMADSAAA